MNCCSKCKSELPTEARYCNVCGTPQVQSASSSTSSEPSSQELSKKTLEESSLEATAPQKPEAAATPTRRVQPTIKYTSPHRDITRILTPPEASTGAAQPVRSSAPASTQPPESLPADAEKSATIPSKMEMPKTITEVDKAKSSEPPAAPRPIIRPVTPRSTATPEVAVSIKQENTSSPTTRPVTAKPSVSDNLHKPTVSTKPGTQKSTPPPAFKTLIWPEGSVKTMPTLPETPRPLTEAELYKHPSQPGVPKSSVQAGTTSSAKESDKLEQEPVVKKDKTPPRPGTRTPTSSPRPGLIRPVGPPTLPKRPVNPNRAAPSQVERIRSAQPERSPVMPSHLTELDKSGRDKSGPYGPHMPSAQLPEELRSLSLRPAATSVNNQGGQQVAEQNTSKEQTVFSGPLQSKNAQVPEQVVRNQTVPNLKTLSRDLPIEEITTGQLPKSNGHSQYDPISAQATLENMLFAASPESMAFTSKEAEQWRRSWRERQEADSEPAIQVSRGQASVPSPLVSTQNSLGRLRAIIPNKQNSGEQSPSFAFWVTLFLMLCLIGGLGIYIVSTYLPNTPLGTAHIGSQGTTFSPTISISGPQTATFKQGQKLQLHGEHFAPHDPITFLLDTTTPILNTTGHALSASVTDAGTFDVIVPIGMDWTTGPHVISAEDTRTNASAYLNMQVDPAGTANTTSPDLALYLNGQHLQRLTFSAIVGQANPPQQRITIMNTSGAKLQWTAIPIAGQNLSWLVIDDNHTSGTLDIDGTDSIGISALLTGLKSSTKPYNGQIVFTINGKEQLTLPVELQVEAPSAEMTFSPNPIIAYEGAGGTCKPGTTLTLINLGAVVITWAVNPDENIKSNIQFLLNGQLTEEGQLLPADSAGDTVVLTLKCAGVQVGDRYHITIYANTAHWDAFVLIQGQG